MDHVILDPSVYYTVESLNKGPASTNKSPDRNDNTSDESEEIFGSSYMNPMDTRQYLYKLIPTEDHIKELKAKVCVLIAIRILISWPTSFMETQKR